MLLFFLQIPFIPLKVQHTKKALMEFVDNADPDFVCVEVLQPSQPNGIMSSSVSLPNHTFIGQA